MDEERTRTHHTNNECVRFQFINQSWGRRRVRIPLRGYKVTNVRGKAYPHIWTK